MVMVHSRIYSMMFVWIHCGLSEEFDQSDRRAFARNIRRYTQWPITHQSWIFFISFSNMHETNASDFLGWPWMIRAWMRWKICHRKWNSCIEYHFLQLQHHQFINQQLYYLMEWFSLYASAKYEHFEWFTNNKLIKMNEPWTMNPDDATELCVRW